MKKSGKSGYTLVECLVVIFIVTVVVFVFIGIWGGGHPTKCINGVSYILGYHGPTTPAYDRDGKIVACDE